MEFKTTASKIQSVHMKKKTTPLKLCPQCGQKCRASSEICKKCVAKGSDYMKNAQLKHHYGIDVEQYQDLKEQQGNRCGICGRAQIKMWIALSVDHNHNTNKVRGLLCGPCNHAIGMLEADYGTELLEAAIDYIKRTDQ
jgi:hypothetical protein